MKTVENPVQILVELRDVGEYVVAAKVSASLRLHPTDLAFVSDCVLDALLPSYATPYRLYDGAYVAVSGPETKHFSCACVDHRSARLSDFNALIELEDGSIHSVRFSLEQSDDLRRDYTVANSRFIQLRGYVSLEVDDRELGDVEGK